MNTTEKRNLPKERKPFPCPVLDCPAGFSSRHMLKQHHTQKHPDLPWPLVPTGQAHAAPSSVPETRRRRLQADAREAAQTLPTLATSSAGKREETLTLLAEPSRRSWPQPERNVWVIAFRYYVAERRKMELEGELSTDAEA